jgi:hypothetical protein
MLNGRQQAFGPKETVFQPQPAAAAGGRAVAPVAMRGGVRAPESAP